MTASGARFDEATLAALEFGAVVEQIAQRATCGPGAAEVRALRPCERRGRAAEELALVEDAIALLEAGLDVAYVGVEDVAAPLDRAGVGSALSGLELRAIARSERSLASAAAAIENADRSAEHNSARNAARAARRAQPGELRPLQKLVAQRHDAGALVRRMEAAIDDDGSVTDAASPDLARVRRHMRSLSDDIRKRVDDIVRSPNTAKHLSEQIVTMRAGRYVVPVRIDAAASVPGVVHGESASGGTVFVEPMACVEANNRLRSLEAEEEREQQRVLAALSAAVAPEAQGLARNAALLAHLDCIFARARWAVARAALAPALVDGQIMRIVRGRHPLLRHEAVPLDIEIGVDADAIVISGPNMGGKTVVLKTLGLFCALAHAGIPVPAGAGSTIGEFDHVACIIGDEQSIADDLSSFSAHLRALRAALDRAGPRTLVLVDEIGSGTEPGAGAALAQAFIEALLERGSRVVVTTHYTQLKIFAASRDRARNASMLFDAQTFAPAYALAMGVPGQSLAFALARTIGVDAAAIRRAEDLLGADAQNLERAFEGLAAERERVRAREAELARDLASTRAAEADLRARTAAADEARAAFERSAAETLERAVRSVREELLARAESSAREARRQRVRAADEADAALAKTMADIRRSLGLEAAHSADAAPGAYRAGDRVFVKSFGQAGVVSEVYDHDVLVTIGTLKAVVPRADITRDPAAGPDAPARRQSPAEARVASLEAATSIDVRGMRVEEAVPIVDRALDDASLAGLPLLRIIHGKGTGQLGRGIREFLKGHAQVRSCQAADEREGGSGVTVVTLR